MRMFSTAFMALAFILCNDISLAFAQDTNPSQPEQYTYHKVGGRALTAHVFSPVSDHVIDTPASAILLFHGGGWSVGAPEWTFTAARRFAAHGMVAIPIEYRLSEGSITPIDALSDVCHAFRWAREHASELRLDPSRVAGYGVSAGGHLVTSAATVGCPQEDTYAIPSTPDALLLWSPALDMAGDGWFERKLSGRATALEYSPVEHIGELTPPTSIVQGAADTLTPLSGAERYCARLLAAGGICELNVYGGLGHLPTRNLEYQENNFDPDPEAVAAGVAEHVKFLRQQGFI